MRSAGPRSQAEDVSAVNSRSVAGACRHDTLRLADILAGLRASRHACGLTGAASISVEQGACGPDAALAALWDRVRLDPRHRMPWAGAPAVVTARHFPGSAHGLATTTANLARLDPWLIDDLATPADGRAPAGHRAAGDPAAGPAPRDGATRLVQSRAAALAAALSTTLAAALAGTDHSAARGRLDASLGSIGLAECAAVVQALLDRMHADGLAGGTTGLQRQLSLTLLQSALRPRLDIPEQPGTIGCALVSALPGTPDLCGVMLKVALLRRSGWSVRLLLPQDADGIRAAAQDLQPDLIVLAGSRLAVRPAELPLLRGLLPALRAESPAPVILGGRLSQTDPQTLLRLGGAAVCTSMAWVATIAATVAPSRDTCPPTGIAATAPRAPAAGTPAGLPARRSRWG